MSRTKDETTEQDPPEPTEDRALGAEGDEEGAERGEAAEAPPPASPDDVASEAVSAVYRGPSQELQVEEFHFPAGVVVLAPRDLVDAARAMGHELDLVGPFPD